VKEASRLLHSSILTVEKDRIDLEDDTELDGEGLTAEEAVMIDAEESNTMESDAAQPASQVDRKRRMDYEEFERAKELLVSRVRRAEDGKPNGLSRPGTMSMCKPWLCMPHYFY
jgi:DNA replication licensing factor MCM6